LKKKQFLIQPKIIDEINILNASIKAMQECILRLNPTPSYIIVDGNRFKPINNIPFSTIIKGDSKYLSIAAASVLAKTYRDEYMNKIHEEFPMYNWKQNKGYPTKEHREAIRKYGTTKYHRMSFRLLPEQLSLEL
jgi:ribonuclease HII